MRYHLAERGGFSWNRLKDDRSVYGSGIHGEGILLPETSVSGLSLSFRYNPGYYPADAEGQEKRGKEEEREKDRGGEEKGRDRQRVVSSVGKVDTWPARSSKVSSMLTDLSIGSPRTISLPIPFRFFDPQILSKMNVSVASSTRP